MKLRELLQEMKKVQEEIGSSPFYICGGTPRDKYMGRLDNVADIDITTGDKTVDYLSQEFTSALRDKYNVTRKTMSDGHSSIFIGNLKIDFSSNFIVNGIDAYLQKIGIAKPSNLQKEMFSRDFTCNSLLLTSDLKQILDPTKRGFKDIKEKKIKTCLDPSITLTSNRNRVIRAIYLACKLDFDIDESIINYVKNNVDVTKISSNKVMTEKMNDAFSRNPERASDLITKMGLWNHLPITEKAAPFYQKNLKSNVVNHKKAYFQGGGGINEPTPGKTKYKVEPAITMQSRFVEPFYRNYDLYDTEGLDGPAKHGPGSGWNELQKHKSVKEFLEFRRKRLKGKYVADDSWIEDTSANYKSRVDKMKVRAELFSQIIKTAEEGHWRTTCSNCGAVVSQCRCMGPKIEKTVPYCSECKKSTDENNGPNYDLGTGLYENMGKYKSVKDFIDNGPKSPGALMDVNDIDFPVDDQIGSGSIIGDSPSYSSSVGIGGNLDEYLPQNDFEGKTPDELDFGRDYTEDAVKTDGIHNILDSLMTKYLNQDEIGLFGLPDGISPNSDLDADNTVTTENPDYDITDSGRQMYEDKWNI